MTTSGAPQLRLILDPPAPGAWNMAVDEALLIDAAERRQATLRFYEWSEPTLSLGYFQRYDDRKAHQASLECPLVRRSSGGGAIVHDAELTYSLALPFVPSQTSAQLYATMHDALIAALAGFGVAARRLGESAPTDATDEPFLCFARRAKGDVLAGQVKIAGSAQRRRACAPTSAGPSRAVLQHGSVLLRGSAAAPELLGIAEVCGPDIGLRTLAQSWLGALGERGWKIAEESPLPGYVRQAALELARDKYDYPAWNRRR